MPLSKIYESDVELILEWRNHPDIRFYMFNQEKISLDDHVKWFTRESTNEKSVFLIYSDDNGKKNGLVSFTNIDKKNGNAFWGFYAAPDSPKGTGTAMCSEALHYFLDKLNLKKLNAEVLAFNEASRKLHEKLGFTMEGVIRSQSLIREKYIDVVCYGITREEIILQYKI